VKIARALLFCAGVLPWLGPLLGPAMPPSVKLAIAQVFAALCHHLLDRTLVWAGSPMCVCSRCAGIYAGLTVAALWPSSRMPSSRFLKRASEGGLCALVVDVATQDSGLHAPWHAVRVATGLWVGAALAAWMLQECTGRRPNPTRSREKTPKPPQRFSATLSRAERSASRSATVARYA
jgi:uncharacterized membrane protein